MNLIPANNMNWEPTDCGIYNYCFFYIRENKLLKLIDDTSMTLTNLGEQLEEYKPERQYIYQINIQSCRENQNKIEKIKAISSSIQVHKANLQKIASYERSFASNFDSVYETIEQLNSRCESYLAYYQKKLYFELTQELAKYPRQNLFDQLLNNNKSRKKTYLKFQ